MRLDRNMDMCVYIISTILNTGLSIAFVSL